MFSGVDDASRQGQLLISATVITDPEDSRFDLEAFLQAKAAETAK